MPRLKGCLKLHQEVEVGDGEVVFKPIRTEENHMKELIEIIHRYVPVDALIWDPCCGAMTTLLAALRLNRRVIVSDKDPAVVKLAELRARYYFHWVRNTYPTLNPPGKNPAPVCDGLCDYRFNNIVVSSNNTRSSGTTESVPVYTTAPTLPKLDTDAFRQYCASMGVKVMKSTIKDAGMGLFLVTPKDVGDASDVNAQGDLRLLRVPYFGVYSTKINGNRAITLESTDRNTAESLVLNGDPLCPAGFCNDPMVRPRLPLLYCICLLFPFRAFLQQNTTQHMYTVGPRGSEGEEAANYNPSMERLFRGGFAIDDA